MLLTPNFRSRSSIHSGAPRLWRVLLVAAFTAAIASSGVIAGPAGAATVCTGDVCVVVPDVVQTPLGAATITAGPTNVVTVVFAPTSANTLVIGSPFTIPPVASCPGGCAKGCPGGCARNTITLITTGGLVNIDTIVIPPGPPGRAFVPPNLVIVSLLIPPGPPCRVTTRGSTVVFTPLGTPLGR